MFAVASLSACQKPQPVATMQRDVQPYAVKSDDTLRLTRYYNPAVVDTATPRPCVIFLFGGAFARGSRDAASYQPFFEHLVDRGYEVATIDYRLGLKPLLESGEVDPAKFAEVLPTAISMAVEDLFTATGYLLEHAEAWNIDPTRLVACGSSAGAITALQAEYLLANGYAVATGALPQEFNYGGVISFAGAIVDRGDELHWTTTPAPILAFHGDADSNVPYEVLRFGDAGFFGSAYIVSQLAAMQAPYYFYSVENADHALAVNPMTQQTEVIDYFLTYFVEQRRPLMIETVEREIDAPEREKSFTLMDFVRSNFGE
jgi:hypothetical protein